MLMPVVCPSCHHVGAIDGTPIGGDTTAASECFDRMDGKITRSVDATGQVRGGITFTSAANGSAPRLPQPAIPPRQVTDQRATPPAWQCIYLGSHNRSEPSFDSQSKGVARRAATSLAQLWRDQGKRTEARHLLAPADGWFTESWIRLFRAGQRRRHGRINRVEQNDSFMMRATNPSYGDATDANVPAAGRVSES
jgi:hypothetical protein